MAWVKLESRRALHRKLCAAGFAARGLDEAGICLVCEDGTVDGKTAGHERDAFLSDTRLLTLAFSHGEKTPRAAHKLALILCREDVERWQRDDERGGYWIHDYLGQNKTQQWWDDYIASRQAAGGRGGLAKARSGATAQPRADASGEVVGKPLAVSFRSEMQRAFIKDDPVEKPANYGDPEVAKDRVASLRSASRRPKISKGLAS